MNKEKDSNIVELEGVVTQLLPGSKFTVDAGGVKIRTSLSGRMRQNLIKIIIGDKVKVEVSDTCLTEGRITYRL